MPGGRTSPQSWPQGLTNSIGIFTMNNARPSARQLNDFYKALQAAADQSRSVRPIRQLEAARDAYLASLR